MEQDRQASDVVLYHQEGPVAVITMNRPRYRNAQNSQMTYALDGAFYRAAQDDDVRAVVLAGAGPSFSGGHDIGSPGRDHDRSFPRHSLWWDHTTTVGAESRLAREEEVYIGMCRRWRDLPKPTIAAVQGACVGGGLMLAWSCDLIVAADDAWFADPVIDLGMPGVEFFAHPWELGVRRAKEFLFLGDPIAAAEAHRIGMVSRVVPQADLLAAAVALAGRIAEKPRLALALTKKSVNLCADQMGQRTGIDLAFGLHQLAHAHNAETTGDPILGRRPSQLRRAAPAATEGVGADDQR